MKSRREFLQGLVTAALTLPFANKAFGQVRRRLPAENTENPFISLYRALNGTPADNLRKVVGLMGGIEKIVGPDDVVVIKPNVQWWNQGAPNLAALAAFVDLIMGFPGGFRGEVVIAENCHRGPAPWDSSDSGWAPCFERNSDLQHILNMSGLVEHLKKRYGRKFTACHWVDVSDGGRRVYHPKEGPGYVYCDGTGGVPLLKLANGAGGVHFREVIMSYPVFKTDRGTVVDFKNGIWQNDQYTDQPLRFINFAALNHHSTYCGATSAVKNYLGISDISNGADPHKGGRLTGNYYNFHSFPFDKWGPGPVPGMIGAEIGVFLKTVRKADLNITTAEWVGLASRTEPPVSRTRAVLACADPVALDYHATKYLLYPNSSISFHSPDNAKGPLHAYLVKCAQEGGCTYDEARVAVQSYDFKTQKMQDESNLYILGEKHWGTSPRSMLKYLYMRYGLS